MEQALLSTNIIIENAVAKMKQKQYKILTESENPQLDQVKLQVKSSAVISKFVEMTNKAVAACASGFKRIASNSIPFFKRYQRFVYENDEKIDDYIDAEKWIKVKDIDDTSDMFSDFMDKIPNIYNILQQIYYTCGFTSVTPDYGDVADKFDKAGYNDQDVLYKEILQGLTDIDPSKATRSDILEELSNKYISKNQKEVEADVDVVNKAVNILDNAEEDIKRLLALFGIVEDSSILEEIATIARDVQEEMPVRPEISRYYRCKYKILSTAKMVLIDLFNIGYKSLNAVCENAHDIIVEIVAHANDSTTNESIGYYGPASYHGAQSFFYGVMMEAAGDIPESPEELSSIKKEDIKDFKVSDLDCDIDKDVKETIEDNKLKPVYIDDENQEIHFVSDEDGKVWKYDTEDDKIDEEFDSLSELKKDVKDNDKSEDSDKDDSSNDDDEKDSKSDDGKDNDKDDDSTNEEDLQ
jgi:hypothetical protein